MNAALTDLLARWLDQTRSVVVLQLDADGVVTGASESAQTTLGWRPDELVGRPLSQLFTPEDRSLGLDHHELEVAAQAGQAQDDRWHLRRDGARIWVSGLLGAVRGDAGELLGFVKLMRDRTDLAVRIAALESRIEALAGSEQRRNLFIATLGHELRNPLAPLANAAELLRRAGDDDRLVFPLGVIDRQLALLRRLVDDLLDMTRIDSGRLELQLRPIGLQDAVREAVEACRPKAELRRIGMMVLLPAAPITLEADPARLQQMLVNLLDNAIKYTPPGGQVWVKATVDSGNALVRVEDNG
ncbi:MAG TPA: PAS domain-containing sensor histidine kinase, partial [Ideonella sp.]|nr:PAS domain-containing sensor histidine kinase [Ideonella sp.]